MERWKLAVIAMLLVGAAALPLVSTTSLALTLLDPAATYALVALGLNLLIGTTGQFSLGHAGFFAIGAFSAGILGVNYNWPFWLTVPAAGLVASCFGLAIGLPTLRLIGPYFSMATLGFGLLVAEILSTATWAGGRTGITLNPPQVGAYSFDELSFFWIVLGVVCIAIFAVYNLRQGATGRAFVGLRDSPFAAQACGVHLARFRIIAFVISALLTGVAGALFAQWSGYLDASNSVSSTTFGLPASISFVAMVVVGGLDSTVGSLLGALFLTGMQYWLQDRPELAQTLYGAALVAVLLFLPRGLAGVLALSRTIVQAQRGRIAVGGHEV